MQKPGRSTKQGLAQTDVAPAERARQRLVPRTAVSGAVGAESEGAGQRVAAQPSPLGVGDAEQRAADSRRLHGGEQNESVAIVERRHARARAGAQLASYQQRLPAPTAPSAWRRPRRDEVGGERVDARVARHRGALRIARRGHADERLDAVERGERGPARVALAGLRRRRGEGERGRVEPRQHRGADALARRGRVLGVVRPKPTSRSVAPTSAAASASGQSVGPRRRDVVEQRQRDVVLQRRRLERGWRRVAPGCRAACRRPGTGAEEDVGAPVIGEAVRGRQQHAAARSASPCRRGCLRGAARRRPRRHRRRWHW